LPNFTTPPPPIFDGEPNSSYRVNSFIAALEDYRALNPHLTEIQVIFMAALRFKAASPAKLWWENLRLAAPINSEGYRCPFPSLSAFTEALRNQFTSPNLRRMLYAELTTLHCVNRDIPTYAAKFRNLLIQLKAAGATVPYHQAEDEFFRGLPRDCIPDKFNFKDEDEMINYVINKHSNKYVHSKMPSKIPSSSQPSRPYGRYHAMDDDIRFAYNHNPFDPLQQQSAEDGEEEDYYDESEDPNFAAFNPRFTRGGKSFSRGRGPQHPSTRPPQPRRPFTSAPLPSNSKPTTSARAPLGPQSECPRCKKPGHWAADCPNPTRATPKYPLSSPPPQENK